MSTAEKGWQHKCSRPEVRWVIGSGEATRRTAKPEKTDGVAR